MNKILVVGGSGVLGSSVVATLQQEQADFLSGSRKPIKNDSYSVVSQSTNTPWQRIDLATGEGLRQALEGVDTVFHLASAPTKIGNEPFDVVATRNLLNALNQSDVKHLIYSSIVGVDTIQYSYYRAKRSAERLIQASQIPYTILRATQFHNLLDFAIGKLLSLPIGFIPRQLKVQPIHVDTVTAELYRLVQAGPQQTIINLGGPKVYDVGTMTQLWMKARNVSKPVIPIPTVGSLMKSLAKGENTCPNKKAIDSADWEEYLRETYG
ncbi:NAD(P)H-binding protein [Spirosoma terrae]|uniref:NAD(P)H-binding protein n=1 Tax=Spirosoma terrae TaxID=1968276 RepID=A0A6L9LC64_9BACT|nr:NAD(P)H-binding protein [Spirosoma terrae]NDU98106.1 NAD(P)H-binding protein [Spirosoma terrae]